MKVSVKISTQYGIRENKGYAVGMFVVHRVGNLPIECSDSKWGITHVGTGLNACDGPTKDCCMHAARRLRDLGVNWDFSDPKAVYSFRKATWQKIRVIRASCAHGGYA